MPEVWLHWSVVFNIWKIQIARVVPFHVCFQMIKNRVMSVFIVAATLRPVTTSYNQLRPCENGAWYISGKSRQWWKIWSHVRKITNVRFRVELDVSRVHCYIRFLDRSRWFYLHDFDNVMTHFQGKVPRPPAMFLMLWSVVCKFICFIMEPHLGRKWGSHFCHELGALFLKHTHE